MKCCDIKIGDLNRKIMINTLNETDDGQGGQTITPVLLAEPWVKMTPMKGREKVQSDRLTTEQLTQVLMRYRSDVTEKQQVVYKGEEYQIRSVVNIEEADEWLELMIERVAAQ